MLKIKLLLVFIFCSELNAQCFYFNNRVLSQSATQTSNISSLDVLLSNALSEFEQFFGYSVDLGYCTGFNGAAIPFKNGYIDGKIRLGRELMKFEYQKKGLAYNLSIGSYFAIAVLAHEYAHIIQFNHPELVFPDVVTQEIHADMIAGYLLARLIHKSSGLKKWKALNNDETSKIETELLINFGRLGDESYWSTDHHGNYIARCLAINHGWEVYENKIGPVLSWVNGKLVDDPNWNEMYEFTFWLLQRPNGYNIGIEDARHIIRKYDN